MEGSSPPSVTPPAPAAPTSTAELDFTEEEKKVFREHFNAFTKKADPNHITMQEACITMRSLGYLFLESDFVRIFDELYKGQQVVDFDMFLTLLDKIKPLCATETEIRQAFLVAHKKIFPKQGECLDADYFRRIMMLEGERLTQDECDELMRELQPPPPDEGEEEVDKDGNPIKRGLPWDDFLKIMQARA